MTLYGEGGPHRSYAFGPFVLIPQQQTLLCDGAPVRIGGRALDLLTALAERPGELLSKRALMARAWPDVVVDDSNLKVNMAALRRILGHGGGDTDFIATVTGRGYRFIAAVNGGEPVSEPPSVVAFGRPEESIPWRETRVVGRDETIEALAADLAGTRLLSIVGAGGVGKSTVAHAVAQRRADAFQDGVWVVDLSPLRTPHLLFPALAATLGLSADAVMASAASAVSGASAAMSDFLRGRELLIVLDNCEHLIDAAAACATRLLAQTDRVKVLITSREPLMLSGERVRRLQGLACPPLSVRTAREAMSFAAAELFVERASERLQSFQLTDADAPRLARLCHRLDGLALALELAATRIDTCSLTALLAQLESGGPVGAGQRAGPARHRSLSASLDWSFGLLSPGEAGLLQAVSVFEGRFDLDAAADEANVSREVAAAVLAGLTAKSLVITEPEPCSFAYRLLETTRAYCLERLHADTPFRWPSLSLR